MTGQEVFSFRDRLGDFAVSSDGSCIAFPSMDGIELLEGSPLTTDAKTNIEANGLVEFLYATEKTAERVVARVNTISTISEAVRRESLRLAEARRLSRGQLDTDGWAGLRRNSFATGIGVLTEVIRLDPKNVLALTTRGTRGTVWQANDEFDKALADYDAAIEIDPQFSAALNSRAWLRATCHDEKYRDGAKAVEDATKASELADWKDFNMLDTLAAAYAESGQFDKAVEWQEKAIELAPEEQKEGFRSRLKLYQERKPYREEPKN